MSLLRDGTFTNRPRRDTGNQPQYHKISLLSTANSGGFLFLNFDYTEVIDKKGERKMRGDGFSWNRPLRRQAAKSR